MSKATKRIYYFTLLRRRAVVPLSPFENHNVSSIRVSKTKNKHYPLTRRPDHRRTKLIQLLTSDTNRKNSHSIRVEFT